MQTARRYTQRVTLVSHNTCTPGWPRRCVQRAVQVLCTHSTTASAGVARGRRRAGDERRSCRANEGRKTKRKKRRSRRRRGVRATGEDSYRAPYPRPNFLVIYVKIFHHGAAALSACNAPKTFVRDASSLPRRHSPSRSLSVCISLSFYLTHSMYISLPAPPTRRKVLRGGGGRINFVR